LTNRRITSRVLAATLAILSCTAPPASKAADPEKPGGTYTAEVRKALVPLFQQYGADAVNLQGNLLRHSIDHGSLLDASAGISGTNRHQESSYLVIAVETGMVFKDSEVPEPARPARIWTDVIGPSLRTCKRLDLTADGVEIRTSYHHSDFADRTDLARRVRAGTVIEEAATFRLKTPDVVELAQDRISEDELLRRTSVEVNGTSIHLQLPSGEPQAK
jgi:hypothetical protein